jgi:hypothetical protein
MNLIKRVDGNGVEELVAEGLDADTARAAIATAAQHAAELAARCGFDVGRALKEGQALTTDGTPVLFLCRVKLADHYTVILGRLCREQDGADLGPACWWLDGSAWNHDLGNLRNSPRDLSGVREMALRNDFDTRMVFI